MFDEIEKSLPQDKETLFGMIDQKYKTFALNAQENKLNREIYNSNIIHAIFLSELLISQAKDSIKIFSGTITEFFFNNSIIKKAFEKKLNEKKDINLNVVVEKYENIPNWMKEKDIEIRILDKNKDISIRNHMMLIDKNAFRIEEEHPLDMFKKKEKWNVIAEVNFSNEKDAKMLNTIYDTIIFKNSKKIEV